MDKQETVDTNKSFLTENPGQSAEVEAINEGLDLEFNAVMEGPRENSERLLAVADSLNVKMRGLLEKEKEEFVAAYRAHTRKVQEDLARLRQRVAEEEESLHRDEKVKRLQNERDAFRAEALALDAGNSQLAKDLEALRSKLEVLEDDRNFLVRQMKKGHSKPARSPRPEQDSGQPGSPQKQHRGTLELLKTLNTPVSQHLPPIGGAAGKTKAGVLASSEEQQGQDRALSKGLRRELQGLKAALGIERRQLETMSREVGLVQGRRESNWLEALLLDCVRVVGGEVAQRRAAAEAGQGHSRRTMGGGGGGGGCGEATGASLSSLMSDGNELAGGGGGGGGSVQQQPSLVSDPWGETLLKLELFTAADRCSVLQTLISDPRVQRGLAKRRQDMEQQAIEERHNQRSREGQHQQGQGRGEGQPQSINRPGGNKGGNGGYGWDKQGDTPTRVSWIRGGE